jgi:LCP family protein required for cell wall assembly
LAGLILAGGGMGLLFTLLLLQLFGIKTPTLQQMGLPSLGGLSREKILLVMGVDASQAGSKNPFDATRTDTMLLVRLNPANHDISIVSIPRDSKVYLAENHGIGKINAAHALGGPELAVKTVEQSFGIPVDNYLVVNFAGVSALVDAIGGVDVFIEKPLHYRDRTARLNIDFSPGLHHLDGKQAEEYLRFRHDAMGDIGRIRRQQYFMAAVAKELKTPATLTRLPQLVGVATQYTKTNLNQGELLNVAGFMKDVNQNRIRTATLPGRPSLNSAASYWIVDPTGAQSLLDRLILNAPAPRAMGADGRPVPLSVGLLYTDAYRDQLQFIETQLAAKGFNVVCRQSVGKSHTQIIERSYEVSDRDTEAIRSAAQALKSARLVFSPRNSTYESNICSASEDYTVILGEDALVSSAARGAP